MFSIDLLDWLRCPTHRAPLQLIDQELYCTQGGEAFPLRDGYVEILPGASFKHTTQYADDAAGHMLDYRDVGIPLLSAKIKNDLLNQFLQFTRDDAVLDLGCGNGKFAYWNRARVRKMLALDLAPWFADQAKAELPLLRSDIRVLPFDDTTFDKIFSIDVLEHLTAADLARVLTETRRVLKPHGRFFVFSNTRERQTLWWVMTPQKALTNFLHARRVIDFRRDEWRKSDHVKAIEKYDQLRETFDAHGFAVKRVAFWNGIFQGWIENVVIKLGESWLSRRAPGQDEGEKQIAARQQVRASLASNGRGKYYAPLAFLTALMNLDLMLFGRLRAGPYFLLVEKM